MRDLLILLIHLIATLARLMDPGGARSVVAESLLVKQQLLILNRSRQRAPNLRASDRILAGVCALFMRRARVIRSAIVLKPSTILDFHRYCQLDRRRALLSTIESGLRRQSAGTRHRVPFDKRPCAKQAVMGRPQQVSTDPKQILHGTVHRQEALRLADRRESSHLALALPRRLMRDFRSVVLIPAACCARRTASRYGAPRHSYAACL